MTYPNTYDTAIQSTMRVYFPQVDWQWGKAQLIAESNLDPNAHSPAGAMGLAQFMPDTWGDAIEHFGWPDDVSPFNPMLAIPAYAWYMNKLWNQWTAPRPAADRLQLAQASYNAGLGNIIKAQNLSEYGSDDYASIIAKLPDVTGQHAQETINYVKRIASIYRELTAAA